MQHFGSIPAGGFSTKATSLRDNLVGGWGVMDIPVQAEGRNSFPLGKKIASNKEFWAECITQLKEVR